MDLDKEVFTTFEAADICHANISSIKNWIADGELEAFKTPGGHYRIPREVLVDFLERHEMPNPFAARDRNRVLVVGPHLQGVIEQLRGRLDENIEYDTAEDAVDALLKIGQWKPGVVVADCRVEELDVAALCRRVDEFSDLGHVQMVVVYEGPPEEAEEFREAGAVEAVALEKQEELVGIVAGLIE